MKIDFNAIEQQGLGNDFKFSGKSVGDVVFALIPYVFVLGGVLLLFYIVMAGYTMLTSGGDPKALQQARGKLTNALVGFLIVFSAYWIVQAMGTVLGLPQFGRIFTP